jgi:hypothetical protein
MLRPTRVEFDPSAPIETEAEAAVCKARVAFALKRLDAVHSQCPEYNAGWNRGEPEDAAAIMLVEAIPACVALSANGKSAA